MITAATLRGALQEFGELLIELIRLAYENDSPYPLKRARSPLLKSLNYRIRQSRNARGQFGTFDGGSFELLAADHLQYVVSGRRPGARKVPIAALIQWIKAKNVGGGRDKRGRFTGQKPADVNRLAYAIQAAIYKRGIRARPYVSVAIDAANRELSAWLDERALDAMTIELDQAFR